MSRTPNPHPARITGRRSLLLGGGALGLGALLSGCAGEDTPPAVPQGATPSEATPVATAEQFSKVMEAIVDRLDKADDERSAKELAPRIVGSAAQFRKASYAIIKKVAAYAKELNKPSATIVVPVTSTTADYPRVAIAVVQDQDKSGNPFFVALSQKDARSPYTTWGWARQSAGITMPSVAADSVGAEAVAADAKDLVMSPEKAMELYAAVLSDGDDKDPDDKLADDPFQKEAHESIWTERRGLNANADSKNELGTIHESYTVHDGELIALRTADGGAMVMGSMRSNRLIKVKNGATVTIKAKDDAGNPYVPAELAGRTSFKKSFSRQYGEIVVLHIPSKDSGKKIQPIGSTKVLLKVEGS